MSQYVQETIIDTGRLPLAAFFFGLIVSFLIARGTARLMRAGVKWVPKSIKVGGVHVHHASWGIVVMLIGGVLGMVVPTDTDTWRALAAAIFGIGTALVLDEFALVLRLRDVYWSTEGRASVVAVFSAIAITGLILLGFRPAAIDDVLDAATEGGLAEWVLAGSITVFNLFLAIVTLMKGKLVTGLVGLFFPFLLIVTAIRLARPASPWARWRYHRPDTRSVRKLVRARTREERRIRRPFAKTGRWLADVIAGRPDSPP